MPPRKTADQSPDAFMSQMREFLEKAPPGLSKTALEKMRRAVSPGKGGMPLRGSEPAKNLTLRVTADERTRWTAQAEADGFGTLAEFIRATVEKRCKRA